MESAKLSFTLKYRIFIQIYSDGHVPFVLILITSYVISKRKKKEKEMQKYKLTIIQLTPVGHEMIDIQQGHKHLISNKREWSNCLIKILKKYC